MEQQPPTLVEENPVQQEIALYHDLLACLDREVQALKHGQEEEILSLAHRKEQILRRLLEVKNTQRLGTEEPLASQEAELLAGLRRQVTAANARNHDLIQAALEVIIDYLQQFQGVGPGLYQPVGKVEPGPAATLFQRRV